MTCVVPTEIAPMPQGLCQDPDEEMAPKDGGSVRKKSEVQRSVRDQIVLDHLPLVKAIAVRVHENLPPAWRRESTRSPANIPGRTAYGLRPHRTLLDGGRGARHRPRLPLR
jgi:hypothetical protein